MYKTEYNRLLDTLGTVAKRITEIREFPKNSDRELETLSTTIQSVCALSILFMSEQLDKEKDTQGAGTPVDADKKIL